MARSFKSVGFLLVASLLFTGLSWADSSSVNDIQSNAQQLPDRTTANWLVLEKAGKGKPEIVVVLRDLPAAPLRRNFPVLLEILWGYESQPNGMPTEASLLQARSLYAGLDQAIGNNGIYVMSKTGNGRRTISYYVHSTEAISPALTTFLSSLPPISIKIAASDDPDWSQVTAFIASLRQ